MKRNAVVLVLSILSLALSMPAMAQDATPKKKLRIALAGLFEEVNIFSPYPFACINSETKNPQQ